MDRLQLKAAKPQAMTAEDKAAYKAARSTRHTGRVLHLLSSKHRHEGQDRVQTDSRKQKAQRARAPHFQNGKPVLAARNQITLSKIEGQRPDSSQASTRRPRSYLKTLAERSLDSPGALPGLDRNEKQGPLRERTGHTTAIYRRDSRRCAREDAA